MKTLILQSTPKGYYLRTMETATAKQREQAEFLGITLASQRGRGIADNVVGAVYGSATDALAAAKKLKARTITARILDARAKDKEEAES